MENFNDMSDMSRRQRIHMHMHNEMQSLEIAAQCIVDFPDAEWELRMELARQCWDETRHTQTALPAPASSSGGRKGEFPVMNYEWGITCMMDSLPARLALQNRTFEGGEMDLLRELVETWRQAGDDETAEVLDGILADEIQHVRFANQWLKRLAREQPRTLLKVAQAVRRLQAITAGDGAAGGRGQRRGRAADRLHARRGVRQRGGSAPRGIHRRRNRRDPAPGRILRPGREAAPCLTDMPAPRRRRLDRPGPGFAAARLVAARANGRAASTQSD